MISLLIPNVAPQGAHIFYTVAMQTFHVQLGVSDISAIFITLPCVSENQIFFCGDTSL